MKTFRLFSMAALALTMAACSSEDNTLETASPAKPGLIPFSATVAPLSGATTRTVYTPGTDGESKPIINVAWKEGDQIFIARSSPLGTAGRVTVGKPNGDGSAPLSGNISGDDGNEIDAYYPASAYDDWGIFTDKYKAQDGTLSGIQDNLDYRIGTGKISVIGGKATLADKLQMKSQIAIWKLTLQNTSGANLNATKVTIKAGSDIIAATKDISATSEVYMAVPFNTSLTTFSDLTIEATTAGGTYTYTAPSAVNLSHSKYYESTVKMVKAYTLAESTVGMIVGSDGKAYAAADKDNLPSGVTAVAMIAYLGSETGVAGYTHGLALALSDKGSMNWSTATGASGAAAHTPAAPTTTSSWMLPSQYQWNKMIEACKNVLGTKNTYEDLRDGFDSVGGTNLKSGPYWSSTEIDTDDAYLFGFDRGGWYWLAKDSDVHSDDSLVRACLAF